MAISEFWVGEIPSRPLEIEILDGDNNDFSITSLTIKARLLGSDNEDIDISDIVVNKTGGISSVVTMRWPTNRSLFNKPGEYLLRLELTGFGTKVFTDTHTIRVRKFGGN